MPPYSGMPYAPAPSWCFYFAELSLYLLFAACLAHAWVKGSRHVGYLLGGVLFGLILEYVNVSANLGYTYGRFLIMFGQAPKDIPLCIGVGWGVIMYTARLFSDCIGLPLWSAAALDALLAINIDLSMDTVAYRLHMWHWDWTEKALDPLTAQWFGVPWGNFFGWLMVVFFYSSFSRLLERRASKGFGRAAALVLVPLLAVLLSQVCLYMMLVGAGPFLHRHFGITSFHRFMAFLPVLGLLVYSGYRKRQKLSGDLPVLAWLVPVWLHSFFFAWLFIGGFYREQAWMTAAATINFLIGIGLHLLVLRRRPASETALASA